MKKILGIIIVLMFVAITGCNKEKSYTSAEELVADMKTNVSTIDVESLKTKQDEMEEYFLLIDVRESQEHIFGYIPGSINLCGGSLIFNIGNEKFWENQMMYLPEKTDEIILYCKKGKRSIIAASMLQQLGYTNVRCIEGGWKEWEMKYPLLYEKNLELNSNHEAEEDSGGC